MTLQERIDLAAADVQASREIRQELRDRIVRLALAGKSVRGAAAELRREQGRYEVLLKFQNDLIRQQLREAFG